MKIFPKRIAINYNPPRICLIYDCNNESFFHDFPVNTEDMKLATEKLYNKLNIINPGYLDQVDKEQVCSLIDLIKQNCRKPSKVQKLRGMVTGYRKPNPSDSQSDSEHEGALDFNEIEDQFESSNSDIDLQL